MITDEEALNLIFTALRDKKKKTEIVTTLVHYGISITDAEYLISVGVQYRKNVFKQQGKERILWGYMAMFFGLILTVITSFNVVFAGLLGVGIVYTLVGVVQAYTGWNIQ
ncbi:hypothetical protein H6F44_22095 [Pseudanabaena sp. FACHB-1277]|jgi:hypothetical protein|uniref:Uncharacterized protein n=1 Tax=Pseudanabaena cinerea FACHB-1277 TaxID=2949581 RepID=A0A926UXJ5_9CYAN|nr:hypothetical protein [Pseudanabaena cinerea]MBD2152783.1 hypothetical protein [Pseudanabaena cinerea FACHB-1277]